MSSKQQTVLLLGATGFLGSQVLNALIEKNNKKDGNKKDKKYNIKALIREGSISNADKIEQLDADGVVQVVRGDMMKPDTLVDAFAGVDVVICTANGYMQGHPEIDVEGANNVVDAIKTSGGSVKRYIYCSVLTADKAQDVEHFWNKKLAEDYMTSQGGFPFIALRPGAFLDQAQDFLGDGLVKRGDSFAFSMWDKTVPIGMIYTPDLAQLFVDAIELPAEANGKSIDVGWTRPIAYEEVVSICARKLDNRPSISVYALPYFVRVGLVYSLGLFSPFWKEMFIMFNYFDGGGYVNNTDLQKKYFGEPPTPEDAIGRYVDKLMAEKEAAEATSEAAAAAEGE